MTILLHGHRAVEQLTLDREVMHLRDSLIPRYAEMVYNGYWFAPEREALQALVDDTQRNVNGVARLKLFKGGVWIAGPQIAQLALRSEDRELRGSGRLQAGRRRRLHPACGRAASRVWRERDDTKGRIALGKVIQFKPPRTQPKLVPRPRHRRLRPLPSQDGRPYHPSRRLDELRGARMLLPIAAAQLIRRIGLLADLPCVNVKVRRQNEVAKARRPPNAQSHSRTIRARPSARGRGVHRVAAVRSAALSP